jgi:Spy/CpxP family protein refolding chaperone
MLAAMVIFGAGVMAGGLLVAHSPQFDSTPGPTPNAEHSPRPPAGERDPRNGQDFLRPRQPDMLSKQFLKQLDTTLKLTTEQRDAIQKIVEEGQEKNRCLWTNVAPEMQRVMQQVRENIRAKLTPEQFKQFEAMMKQQRAPRKPSTNAPPASVRPANQPPAV